MSIKHTDHPNSIHSISVHRQTHLHSYQVTTQTTPPPSMPGHTQTTPPPFMPDQHTNHTTSTDARSVHRTPSSIHARSAHIHPTSIQQGQLTDHLTSIPLTDKHKRLMEASSWKRLWGKQGLVLMGGGMLGKSLMQSDKMVE